MRKLVHTKHKHTVPARPQLYLTADSPTQAKARMTPPHGA